MGRFQAGVAFLAWLDLKRNKKKRFDQTVSLIHRHCTTKTNKARVLYKRPARVFGNLGHQNVVRLYGWCNVHPYGAGTVLEYLEGGSLEGCLTFCAGLANTELLTTNLAKKCFHKGPPLFFADPQVPGGASLQSRPDR